MMENAQKSKVRLPVNDIPTIGRPKENENETRSHRMREIANDRRRKKQAIFQKHKEYKHSPVRNKAPEYEGTSNEAQKSRVPLPFNDMPAIGRPKECDLSPGIVTPKASPKKSPKASPSSGNLPRHRGKLESVHADAAASPDDAVGTYDDSPSRRQQIVNRLHEQKKSIHYSKDDTEKAKDVVKDILFRESSEGRMSEQRDAEKNVNSSAVNHETLAEEKRWDTRSILEYPPEPHNIVRVEDQKRPEDDPSWDTFNAPFDTDVQESSKKAEDDDFMDEVVADTVGEFRNDDWMSIGETEKEEIVGSPEGVKCMDDGPWDISKAPFIATSRPGKCSSDEDANVDMFDAAWVNKKHSKSKDLDESDDGTENDKQDETQKVKPCSGNESLLQEGKIRSEVDETSTGTFSKEIQEGSLTQEERIARYEGSSRDDTSVDESEEEGGEDENSEDSEVDEVQYIAADDEDGGVEVIVDGTVPPLSTGSGMTLVDHAISFNPAAAAAEKAESSPQPELEILDSIDSASQDIAKKTGGGKFLMNRNVPLIPPPSEDKLKRWTDSKNGNATNISAAKPSTLKQDESENIVGENRELEKNTREVGASVSDDGSSPSQDAYFQCQEPNSTLISDKDGQSSSVPCENVPTSPPSSSHSRIRSTGMVSSTNPSPHLAKRFASATSAAAQKFEERYSSITDPATSIKSSQLQNQKAATFFCASGTMVNNIKNGLSDSFEDADAKENSAQETLVTLPSSLSDNHAHSVGGGLVGGAFNVSAWDDHDDIEGTYKSASNADEDKVLNKTNEENLQSNKPVEASDLLKWLEEDILKVTFSTGSELDTGDAYVGAHVRTLLENNNIFNAVCNFVANNINKELRGDELQATSSIPFDPSGISVMSSESSSPEAAEMKLIKQVHVNPFQFPNPSEKIVRSPRLLAANFVSFLHRISKLTGGESPFSGENPFVLELTNSSITHTSDNEVENNTEQSEKVKMQTLVFSHPGADAVSIIRFMYESCFGDKSQAQNVESTSARATFSPTATVSSIKNMIKITDKCVPANSSCNIVEDQLTTVKGLINPKENRNLIVPEQGVCAFELALWNTPNVLLLVLGFLGDPQVVCRMKRVNVFCNRLITEHEHVALRDAVRIGGLNVHLRPAFWIWVTLERCGKQHVNSTESSASGGRLASVADATDVEELERIGREGQWHSVISRDVDRSFGNMPPHKTGAHARDDSIVRALVTWGQSRLMKRGVKGGGEADRVPSIPSYDGERTKPKPCRTTAPPPWETGDDDSNSGASLTPTVSDWSGIAPVGSFSSQPETGGDKHESLVPEMSGKEKRKMRRNRRNFVNELALSGNALTDKMKADLQNKLGFILHALAATHEGVGYCQGMDYVVAHLLRVLQETVVWQAARGILSSVIKSANHGEQMRKNEIQDSHVVEEAVFRVMNSFLTNYNLRHTYWPELRCLKTVCRVFEKLIHLKLPVLADHFDHHELNIGMFALGWFQTLFLYLPSMPSKTVCHMWDIWLVERSPKIFFRVGAAILFLSQPILLNHELEGMMTYLNTFPDATLLKPDILIACALQIKVTNKMLMELEEEVIGDI